MAATVAAEVVLEEAPVGADLAEEDLEAPAGPEARVDREAVLTDPVRMDPMARTLVTGPHRRRIAEAVWDV